VSRNTWQTVMDRDRYDKLLNLPTEDRISLVFEWITLTKKEFTFICEELLLGS
jgi:hypothetical protein